jgi:hypothetical protein
MNKNFQKEVASLNDKLEKMKEALEESAKGSADNTYLQKRLDLLMKKQFVAERRDTEPDDHKKEKDDIEIPIEFQIMENDVMTGMEGHKEYLEKYVYFDKLTKNKK